MRILKAQPLSLEEFSQFGCFSNILDPTGDALCGELHSFYRENSRFYHEGGRLIGFSPITVKKPEKMIVAAAEYHNRTCEAILALNDDFILHVAPANGGEPEPAKTKAFVVPQGVIVTLYPGVWHLCPLPVREPVLNALIILPERTYVNDFFIRDLKPEDQFEITL